MTKNQVQFLTSSSKYAILATDGELKKQVKARQCYTGQNDRQSLMKALADDQRRNGNNPIITHCKLANLHCLVVTNSMKPTQLIWGFHGAYSNAWAFLSFAQQLCNKASNERRGVCLVLPFGFYDVSDANVHGKRGPHLWYDSESLIRKQTSTRTSAQPSGTRRNRLVSFLTDTGRTLRDSGISTITSGRSQYDTTIQRLQIGIDSSCKLLRIRDCFVTLVGFDQGALVVQELMVRLRTPPMLVALWSTLDPRPDFLDRAKILSWSDEYRNYRTKATLVLVCHAENDDVASFDDLVVLRNTLNANKYKTISYIHDQKHTVPETAQKATIETWLDRIKKWNTKYKNAEGDAGGYLAPPPAYAKLCATVPNVTELPEKSEPLANGVVHQSVTVDTTPRAPTVTPHYPGTINPPANQPTTNANRYPDYLPPGHRGGEKSSPVVAGNAGRPAPFLDASAQLAKSNIESKYIQSIDIKLEGGDELRYSEITKDIKGHTAHHSHDPAIFNVQGDSMAFGINSIWDPKGFVYADDND